MLEVSPLSLHCSHLACTYRSTAYSHQLWRSIIVIIREQGTCGLELSGVVPSQLVLEVVPQWHPPTPLGRSSPCARLRS